MQNIFRHLWALPLLILLCLAAAPRQACSAGQPQLYAVQIASMADAGRAQKLYAALRGDLGPELHAQLRVERIGALHAFRIGAFADRKEAVELLDRLRARHPDASLVLAPLLPERIVLPAPQAGGPSLAAAPPPTRSPEAGLLPAARTAPDSAPAPAGKADPAPHSSPAPGPGPESRPAPAEPAPSPAAGSGSDSQAQPPSRPGPGLAPPTPEPADIAPPARPAPRLLAKDAAPDSPWGAFLDTLASSRPLLATALASVLLLAVSLAVLVRAILRRRSNEIAGPWREDALKAFADSAADAPAASPAKPDRAGAVQANAEPDSAPDTGPDAIPAPAPEPAPAAAAALEHFATGPALAAAGPAPAFREVPGPEPAAEEPAQPALNEPRGAALEAPEPEFALETDAEPAPEALAQAAPDVPELDFFAAEPAGALQDLPEPGRTAPQAPEEPPPAPMEEAASEGAVPALSPEFLGRMARNSRELSQVQGNLLSAAKEAKTFYVTSCFNGEGKTTAAVEMAWALAHNAGAKVLLVDWNPGAPRLHELFGVAGGPGLGEYLACGDRDSSIRATAHDNLFLMLAGAECDATAGGGNGAGRRLLRERLAALRESFDYVIYDGHSLIGTSAAILAREFDGIVLVVEAEKTKWEVAQSARERIEGIDGRLVGVVLNKRRFYIPRFLYGKI